MKYIEVEYNRELKALEATLSNVKRPGDFFAAGTVEIPMPRVEVSGVGALSFPVPRPQIEELVRQATQAPYGRGEETIVDTSVRNVWQISPGLVTISGKSWAASFGNILSAVIAGLGCQDASVSAELYKLLVYERGGFFLPHRDTEKTDGMFGTLVVTLPSFHRGGSLRIRHGSREETIETAAADPSEISFAAFYADCEHEVLPVLEGDRVCLVYNLVQEPDQGHALTAPGNEVTAAAAAAILENYFGSPQAPRKIAWLLEHQYSPGGLSFSSLKGADAARAQILMRAASRSGCATYLGIVHIGERGTAEEVLYPRHYRHWKRGARYEEEDQEGTDFSPISVDEVWRYVDAWRDMADQAVDFGNVPLGAGELLPAGALDKEPPDEKRIGATGNEGAAYERAYHRAALVLWPARRTIDVLLDGGVVAALPYLKRLIASGEAARAEAVSAARRIAEVWPASPRSADRTTLIDSLTRLNLPELLEQFILRVLRSAYDGSENPHLLAAAGVLGEERAASVIGQLIAARMADRPGECARLLLGLARPAFRTTAEAAVAGLDAIDARPSAPGREGGANPQFLVDLFSALQRVSGADLCAAAAEKIAARPGVFDPVTLVVPAIVLIRAGEMSVEANAAIEGLWTSAARFLLGRSELPPTPPADWRLDVTLSCKCADCRELQEFASDPAARVHRFRVNQERRSHLEHAIARHRLDMAHVTEQKGSPYTLVCTKDRRTFRARMTEYLDEIMAMRKLLRFAPRTAIATDLGARMARAVALSGPPDAPPQ